MKLNSTDPTGYVETLTHSDIGASPQFEPFSAGDVTSLQMINDSDNRFKGCCVVTYKDSSMADKAIDTLNRSDFKGRKLVVKEVRIFCRILYIFLFPENFPVIP